MRYYEAIFTRSVWKKKNKKEFLFVSTVTRMFRSGEITPQAAEADVWRKVESDPLFRAGWGAGIQRVSKTDMVEEEETLREFRRWCSDDTTKSVR